MSYKRYQEIMAKIADVNYASSVLSWDQETYMPEKGAETRAQQLSTLAGISHELSTANELGEVLEKLSNDASLDAKQKKNISESLKDYKDRKKYSTAFVQQMSKSISECFQSWQKAKKENNFSLYAPHLEKLVKLKREECELLGYENHPYNAMLNQFRNPIVCLSENACA